MNTAISHSPSRQPPLSFQSTPLPSISKWATPSRLALSATKAIHVSLKQHALEDAFLIVNSIRYAALPESQKQHKSWDAVKHIHCPPGISPRLPAHALLHGLVRIGMSQQASTLATAMMNSGIRVHGKTLGRIVDELAKAATVKNASSNASDARLRHHMENLLGTSEILTLKPSMSSDPHTAFALELLHAARRSRSQRTGAMFNTLITLCLINGEIIVASLLLGILVKDWELRSQVLTRMSTPPASETPEVAPSSEKLDKTYRYSLSTKTLRPTPGMLKAIMTPIQERLDRATPDDADTLEFQEALQSLAILASFVNERQLPFPQLSSVIRALARCPMVENWIWITGREGPVRVPAYHYFHDVLLRLIRSLPTRAPPKRTVSLRHANKIASIQFKPLDPAHRMQPPLDSPSYNTLMHYALRNRFSPKLAQQVYEHMTVKREPPLPVKSPDTFNIFLRSAALYRRRDITRELLQVLQQYAVADVWQRVVESKPELSQLPRKLKHAGRSKFQLPPAPTLEQILGDNYTLSTYLSSLISCGQPRLVIQLMQQLLPVFALKRNALDTIRQQKWHESLARAIILGPHVLGTFLNAVVRNGVTKKSHLLFKLIIRAAEASHNSKLANTIKPWNVSVPIYTTMLQAYRTEFKRNRRKTGTRILGYLLRKTTALYEMVKANISQNTAGPDKLDARFYNTLLKTFVEYLPERRTSVAEASKHLASARREHAKNGAVDDRGYLPLMGEVFADMKAHGYPIPIGFQHLFIGKENSTFSGVDDLPEVERRPFAFSKSKKVGGPYTLPVYNKKSLPIIRRRRQKRTRRLCTTRLNS